MAQGKNVSIRGYKAKILGILDVKTAISSKDVLLTLTQRETTGVYSHVGGNSH